MLDEKNGITNLIETWSNAELNGEIKTLEKILSDDYLAVGPFGFLLTKNEWINRHKTKKLKYETFTVEDISLRMYDKTTIVIGREVAKGAYEGNPIPEALRVTFIFVKSDDTWYIVGAQMSLLGQPSFVKRQ